MTGGFSIASFNLHNFNYDAMVGGFGADSRFRKAKTDRISEIIRDGGYDVIALQEVQTPETVASIVGQLNRGTPYGRYSFVHCHDFYETISNDRFKSRNLIQTRGELAFIYDSESVEMFKDYAVYKRLNDRLLYALDYFVSGAVALLPPLLAAGALIRHNRDKPDESDRDDEKRAGRKRKPKAVGVAAVAATGTIGATGAVYAHKYLSWQLKHIRPPFVAFFCKKVGGSLDESRQLRLINVHSQFNPVTDEKFSTGTEIRKKEAEFVLREAFQIVKSEQTENTSLPLTMALGDFNLSGKALQAIADGINSMPMRRDRMMIGVTENASAPQAHLTTVWRDKNGEYKCKNDYDHFAFDMDVWSPNDAKRAFGLESDKFFVFEGSERCPISDHLPVEITTSLF